MNRKVVSLLVTIAVVGSIIFVFSQLFSSSYNSSNSDGFEPHEETRKGDVWLEIKEGCYYIKKTDIFKQRITHTMEGSCNEIIHYDNATQIYENYYDWGYWD